MTSRRRAWLRFWVGPMVVFAIALASPLIGGVTTSAAWFRLTFPLIVVGWVWLFSLALWGNIEERRLRIARARFEDDVVETGLRARRSVSELWLLRSAGFEVAQRAPRRWLLVVTGDAIEVWGGPMRRLVRYARLPLASVVDVQLDEIIDRRQLTPCLLISVATGGDPWKVPLIVLGGSPYALGPADPEELSSVRGVIDAARTSASAPESVGRGR